MKMIKNIVKVMCIFMLAGCVKKVEVAEREKEAIIKREKESIEGLQNFVNKLTFVKHEKSGLCFAYGWEGGTHGGPALTHVPCEKVEHLIKP